MTDDQTPLRLYDVSPMGDPVNDAFKAAVDDTERLLKRLRIGAAEVDDREMYAGLLRYHQAIHEAFERFHAWLNEPSA